MEVFIKDMTLDELEQLKSSIMFEEGPKAVDAVKKI